MRELELKNLLKIGDKEFLVSTISMNVRHSWFEGDNERKVYETMVFEMIDGEVLYDNPKFNERYNSMDEAIAEHGALLKNPKEFFIF
ncbi:MAG: hypothetical protein GXP61_00495 [Epsilonproteobacteria bacterium]|nr:hypothetical protein [Campylobacterota bacterium]